MKRLITWRPFGALEISESVVTGSGIGEGVGVYHDLQDSPSGHYIRQNGAVRPATQDEFLESTGFSKLEIVRKKRAAAYPAIGDQLDCVYKMAKHLYTNNIPIGLDGLRFISDIDAVKQRYPKP